jgi:hypothetical protein
MHFVQVALSGLDAFVAANPGRCPGLPWVAPSGLRCFTAPEVQFRQTASKTPGAQPSASKPNRPIKATAGGGLEPERCRHGR